MRRQVTLLVAAVAVVMTACTPSSDPVETTTTLPSVAGTIDAPEFPQGMDWLNTAAPIAMSDLKGKVVLLDFWTYGCINCIHILPDLRRLEEEFAEELVVIGVHSAKFTNEGATAQLAEVVQRYDITHPVVNDKDFLIWSSWGANAWPTVAVVDPAGRAVGVRAGEGVYEAIQPVIAQLVEEFDRADAIRREPLELTLEAESSPSTPLRYPGKVHASDGRLFVADTGHHRIVEVDPDTGEAIGVWGSGQRGFTDGDAATASFSDPQGLAFDSSTSVLYVADVGNHSVRSIDTSTGEVTTLVGDGSQGWPPTGGTLDETRLASPWALELAEGRLFVANAGTHQIWSVDLDRGLAEPLIGSAREGTLNGPFATSELAQPSGLALSDDGKLYFADSESSSVRVGDLANGQTSLVVGGDETLFDFGDLDGSGNEARLQHPLGLAFGSAGVLYVADTYNSKIKRIDTGTGTVTSWLGSEPGWADGDAPLFDEPGGLAFDGTTLWVADTNNHSLRTIDPVTGTVSTLIVTGLEKFEPPTSYAGPVTEIAGSITASAGPGTITLDYALPDGHKVNPDAPSAVSITGIGIELAGDGDLTGASLPIDVPVEFSEGSGDAYIDVNLVYCAEEAESLCFIDRMRFVVSLVVGPAGPSSQITIGRDVEN